MRGFAQAYRMAIKSILGNKVRSFLTMLGVIIGVSSVIAAVAFALGSTKSITDKISSLGTNLISINITGRGSARDVTWESLQDFAWENSESIKALAPLVSGSYSVKVGTGSRDTTVMGTTPEYETIKSQGVSNGRYIASIDSEVRQKVAVIGTAVAKDLFSGQDPVGQVLKINGLEFQVVGVLEEKEGGQDKSSDDQVIIPVSVAQRLSKNAQIRSFSVQAQNADAVDKAVEALNTYLLGIYKDTKMYRVFNQAQMLSTLSSVTGTMMVILGGIATISLVVGGIGIMNIMLVSVTERTREIGIRKAIGAKRKNILTQFLIEALMVTGIGGLIGVALGLAIIKFGVSGIAKVPAVYSVPWILISFSVSLVVGLVFGIFPAWKAANLNPIEALRSE